MEIERHVILPGEILKPNIEDYSLSQQFTLKENLQIVANQFGQILTKQQKSSISFAIDTNPCKYFPEIDDFVIGVIKSKLSEFYIVDIGGPNDATLGIYEFEGATKKNRPMLQQGQIVYCRVIENNKFMNTRLTCISLTNKKEWMTGEAFFGELKKGFLQKISIKHSRFLMCKGINIMKELQKYCSFEAAVGINGFIWVSSADTKNTIIIINALKKIANLDSNQAEKFLQEISEYFTK